MEWLIVRTRDSSRKSLTARLRADSIRHGIGEVRFLPERDGALPEDPMNPGVVVRIRSVPKSFAPKLLDDVAAELLIQVSPLTSVVVKGTFFYLDSEKGSFHFYEFLPSVFGALSPVRYIGAERRSNVLQLELHPPGQEFCLENRLAPLEPPKPPKRPMRQMRRKHRIRLPGSS